jgi:hypothetical protein
LTETEVISLAKRRGGEERSLVVSSVKGRGGGGEKELRKGTFDIFLIMNK